MQASTQTITDAVIRLRDVVINTPLQYSKRLSEQYHAHIYLKREDLQEVRSFKIRGAYNKMSLLTKAQRKQGIVCASAGNHAQGVAKSCSLLSIRGTIFMPRITPNQKIEKVKHFGGKYVKIELVGETFDEAKEASLQYAKKHNLMYVHPYDDPDTIAGQGTIGLELLEAQNDIDAVIVPIGGGGLISGVSTYLKEKNKHIAVYGCEPKGAAGMYESLKAKKVVTLKEIDPFVDGAAVMRVGDLTYEICKKYVDAIFVVPEGKVCTTMIELYQYEGIVTEPAGALSVATLDSLKEKIRGKNVVCIISGGNNDILRYPEIMERSLTYLGLKHYFVIEFAQKPGQLKDFLNALGSHDDIVLFEYIKKTNKEKGPALVGIQFKNKNDLKPFLAKMDKLKLNYRKIGSEDIMYHMLI